MRIIISAGKYFLNFMYTIIKILPVQDKIVFLSRQHDESNVDFNLMGNQLHNDYPDYKIVVLTKMIHKGLWAKFSYFFHMLRQMYYLATSRVAVLDTYCITVSILHHKKTLKVVQLWHAIGAFKKFGYSILDKEEGSSRFMAEMMQMHENYDYVCTSSKYTAPFFAEAFNVPMSKMIIKPLPRLDCILQAAYQKDKIKEIFKRYPELQNSGKKIILYAPTFRKDDTDMQKPVNELLNYFDQDEYFLIIKLHPLTEQNITGNGFLQDEHFNTLDMCLLADYVITDYSAIVYEAALLKKPLFFYAFDYSAYAMKRDFYIDYDHDMPQRIMYTAKEIAEAVKSDDYDMDRIETFINQNVEKPVTTYTKDICDFIFENCLKKDSL